MSRFDFSLILPCYNEREIFKESVGRIISVLEGTDYTWEIIFIDDCSSDGTQRFIKNAVEKYKKRALRAFFHEKNKGRGATVKEGILKAEGKMVGFLDIDLEVDEWYLSKFLKSVEKGNDMAIAWRIYDFNLLTLPRWVSSKGYVLLRKLVLGLPFKDTEAGYKFFKRSKVLPLIKKSQYDGWFWDTEIMALAYRYKLSVAEIPVAFVRRFDKTSTVKLIPDTINYLKDLISFRIKGSSE